jgi:hypothetical protein
MKQFKIAVVAMALAAFSTAAFAGEGCCPMKAAKKKEGADMVKSCDGDSTKTVVKATADKQTVAKAEEKK